MDCCTVLDPATRPFDVAMLLVMGLTISLGHCVGMCGPLVTAFSVSSRARGIGNRALLVRNVVYHLGRIASYGVIGAIFGILVARSFMVATLTTFLPTFLVSQGRSLGAFLVDHLQMTQETAMAEPQSE